MSPLARPLLALATAALLASTHAEDDALRNRLMESPGFKGRPAACGGNRMGTMTGRKIEMPRFHVDPPRNSPNKFEIIIENYGKPDEVLVGQEVVACDLGNPGNTVEVKVHRHNKYGPLTVTCKKGCPKGVEVIADQFAMKTLTCS